MKWYTSLLICGLALGLYASPKTQKPINQSRYNIFDLPCHVELADIDGDGIRDLVSINGRGEVFLQKGFGLGRFSPPKKISNEYGRSNFVIKDYNGDGTPDIIVTNYLGRRRVLVNKSQRLDPYTGYEPEKYDVMYFGGIPLAIPSKR